MKHFYVFFIFKSSVQFKREEFNWQNESFILQIFSGKTISILTHLMQHSTEIY